MLFLMARSAGLPAATLIANNISEESMKKITVFSMVIVFVLAASCYSATPETQIQVGTITLSPEKTPTPNHEPTSTASAGECLGFRQNLPKNLDGEVVLGGKSSINQPGLELQGVETYLLSLRTGNKIILPEQNGNRLQDILVSPDKKWLVYATKQSGIEGYVYIMANDGTLFKKYPASDWWSILGWIDNNQLLISKLSDQNPYPTLVFNLFTGVIEQELMPTYPEIFKGYSGELYTWGRYYLSETVYKPDLTMLVYPKDPNTIVLWDIKANKEIVELKDASTYSQAPLWLSNRKSFIVDITGKNTIDNWFQDELMMVGIDGQVQQLTNLVDEYQDVAIQNYSESADGRYIAFWFAQVNSGTSKLGIYDMVTNDTRIVCEVVGGFVPPVWSPSKHQLLVDATFDSPDHYGVILIDVDSGILAEVENGVIPVGWMFAP